jgi:DNA uptake protein ComE-like DNA-binding protein
VVNGNGASFSGKLAGKAWSEFAGFLQFDVNGPFPTGIGTDNSSARVNPTCLNDQDKIYVPSINEVVSGVYLENNKLVSAYTQGTTQSKQSASEPTGKISINTASQALLETLKGVGNITASRIIAGRPYKTIDELVDKDILKSALFDSIKDQLDL